MKRSPGILRRLHAGLIWVFLLPLRAYSRLISPALPARCRYYPTCSAYAETAIRRHGIVRGTGLAAWRIVRCNPFSAGGVDEVPPVRERRVPNAHGHSHSHESASHAHGAHA